MILQESLCSGLWCGGSQEPRPPPRWSCPTSIPGQAVCPHLGRSDDAQLEKRLQFGAGSSSRQPFGGRLL